MTLVLFAGFRSWQIGHAPFRRLALMYGRIRRGHAPSLRSPRAPAVCSRARSYRVGSAISSGFRSCAMSSALFF